MPQVEKVILSVLQGATEGIDTLCSPWKTLGMTDSTKIAYSFDKMNGLSRQVKGTQ